MLHYIALLYIIELYYILRLPPRGRRLRARAPGALPVCMVEKQRNNSNKEKTTENIYT